MPGQGASVSISRVSVEHYREPLGISESTPRLSWRFEGDAGDWTQRSYEVKARKVGPAASKQDAKSVSVDSAQSVLVPWPFEPLRSREAVEVSVQATGSDGKPTGWTTAVVEAGLLERSDWTASFISRPKQAADAPKQPFRLRQTFNVPSGARSSARLYATALGLYEVYINGKKAGTDILAPGWTDYRFRLDYQVYDVSDLLRDGENVISAWVGEGWLAGRLGWRGGVRNVYGDRLGLMAQLEVDGKPICLTEQGWRWSPGAILSSEIYDGEVYDSRIDNEEWKVAQSADLEGAWKPVEVFAGPDVILSTTQKPPVRVVERIKPIDIITTPSGKTVIDFGQNFGGYIKIAGEPPMNSAMLMMAFAEVLEKGELGMRPLRTATPVDRIMLGGSVKGWTPTFTFHGFRYVQVDGWAGITLDDLEGCVLDCDMEITGDFKCSHGLLNRLYKNVYYSTRSNTISAPTDCPQRDERLGWTGDIQVFTPTFSYMFDSAGFLVSWLKDLQADQMNPNPPKGQEGIVALVVPHVPGFADHFLKMSQAIWGDVAVLCPSDLHTAFADRKVVEDAWTSIVTWLDVGVKRDDETGLWNREIDQLGDWLAPAAPPDNPGNGPTDNHLVADAYLVHTTRVASRLAGLIGKKDEQKRYAEQADKLLRAWHDMWMTKGGRTVSDTQTAIALILYFDLVDPQVPDQREKLAKRLEMLVQRDRWFVATGFAGTPIILNTLARHGHLAHAYRMLQGGKCPSWLSPVLLGATTIWERWDSMLADGSINPGEMTSFNHYALGSVAHFLHSVVAGVSPLEPGWKKILFKPQPGGTITSATTHHVSPYGKIHFEWQLNGHSLEVKAQVPPNSVARVELPGMEPLEVGSGTYHWQTKIGELQWPPPAVPTLHFESNIEDYEK